MSDRTLAPLGRRLVELTQAKQVGAYRLMTCCDPDGPLPQAGQFYMLCATDGWGGGEQERPFLPRPYSYLRASGENSELSFIFEDVGPGSHVLGSLQPPAKLWLMGPLGIGFWRPDDDRRALLVGGGIGLAPLAAWQTELADQANAVALLGFRGTAHADAAHLLRDPQIATDDGSVGHHGLVTELLESELDRDSHATVYACGPPRMLEAVRLLCERRAIPAQLAMESTMACGFGACFGCVVPTRDGYLRLCVDGPVIDAARVQTALEGSDQ